MSLQVKLFGTFEASLDGQPLAGLRTDKVRALLAYLLVEAARAHTREFLADLLWPDQPSESALHNLRQALSTLRKALGDDAAPRQPCLLLQKETIQWNPAAPARVDVHEFDRLAIPTPGAGRLHIRQLQRAFDLYSAPFLEHFTLPDSSTWEEWALLTREVYNQKAIQALNNLLDYHERRQEYARAAQLAGRLLKLAPWDETLHAAAMRLQALEGNWSAALAQYAACRRYLKAELDVEPTPATQALFESIRRGAAGGQGPAPRFAPPRHTLPQPGTPFTGRAQELDDLAARLADPHCRLITLLGPGGIGKTRLALEAARQQVGVFADGVFFIPLGSVTRCELLPAAIAEGLGLRLLPQQEPARQLFSALRGKCLLLVLDALEQLPAAPCLAELLQAAPQLVILATSRVRLNLQEEWVYVVDGLPTPPPGQPPAALETYPAARLFLNALQRSGYRLPPPPAEQDALGQICRLVEGAPLSLELAAPACRVRSLAEIAAELSSGMDILSSSMLDLPPRHRSLRATLEHSWALLTGPERSALACLGIFTGAFDVPAALQVTQAPAVALDGLVEKFLVKRGKTSLYWLHNALRQFAREKLQLQPGAEEAAAGRHAAHYAALLAQCEAGLDSPLQQQTLASLSTFAEEFIQAWRFAVQHRLAHLLEQSLGALYLYMDLRSRYTEAIELFQAAVEALPPADALRARILTRLGVLCNRIGRTAQAHQAMQSAWQTLQSDGPLDDRIFCLTWLANFQRQSGSQSEARTLAEEALQLARTHQRPRGTSAALYLLSTIQSNAGEYEPARQSLEESLRLARGLNNPRLLMNPLNALADIHCYLGDYQRAIEIYSECLEISRQLGDRYNQAMQLNNLGTAWHILQDYSQAGSLYQRSLELCRDIGDENGVSIALSNLGELSCQAGDFSRAESFFAQGLEIARRTRDTWSILASLNNLGMACTALGRLAEARLHLLEGLALAAQAGLHPRLLQSLVLLAEWLEKAGQPARACLLARSALADPALEDYLRPQALALLERCGNLPGPPPPAAAELVAGILEQNDV